MLIIVYGIVTSDSIHAYNSHTQTEEDILTKWRWEGAGNVEYMEEGIHFLPHNNTKKSSWIAKFLSTPSIILKPLFKSALSIHQVLFVLCLKLRLYTCIHIGCLYVYFFPLCSLLTPCSPTYSPPQSSSNFKVVLLTLFLLLLSLTLSLYLFFTGFLLHLHSIFKTIFFCCLLYAKFCVCVNIIFLMCIKYIYWRVVFVFCLLST